MSELYKNKYRIKSNRHPTWDYASNGYYFVTICTKNKESFFGDIVNEKIELNRVSKIVEKYWREIPRHFSNVKLDEFVIMPNHLHGIIVIENDDCKSYVRDAQLGRLYDVEERDKWRSGTLGVVINQFKRICTIKIKTDLKFQSFAWQVRFYDHIIQKPQELFEIQKYIQENPLKWHLDKYFL